MSNWISIEGRLADGLPMRLYVAEWQGKLSATCLHDDLHPRSADEFERQCRTADTAAERLDDNRRSDVLRAAEQQVLEYFAGKRLRFELPLRWHGTDFQLRVWQELTRVSFGQTPNYGTIAERIGVPNASRAVGTANGRNRLPLLVPCHRIIAAAGKIGGFTGGIGLKKRLLAHEAAVLGIGTGITGNLFGPEMTLSHVGPPLAVVDQPASSSAKSCAASFGSPGVFDDRRDRYSR